MDCETARVLCDLVGRDAKSRKIAATSASLCTFEQKHNSFFATSLVTSMNCCSQLDNEGQTLLVAILMPTVCTDAEPSFVKCRAAVLHPASYALQA